MRADSPRVAALPPNNYHVSAAARGFADYPIDIDFGLPSRPFRTSVLTLQTGKSPTR